MSKKEEVCEVLKTDVVEMFQEIGFHGASGWDETKLREQIKTLPDIVNRKESGTDDYTYTVGEDNDDLSEDDASRLNNTLDELIYAVDNQQRIVFTETESKSEPEPESESEEMSDEVAELKAKLEALEAENQKLKNGKKRGKREGIQRDKRTRCTVVGEVIAKHGMDVGITPEMVDEIDAGYGKSNRNMSEAMSRYGWHAINGYLQATAAGNDD